MHERHHDGPEYVQPQDRLVSVCHFESLKGLILSDAPHCAALIHLFVARPADNTLFIYLPLVKVSVYV